MKRYDSYKDSGVKWLGEIPSHWEMLALKHILKHKKEVVGKRSSQYDLLSLTLKGVIIRDMDNPEGKFPASFDTYQIVEPNDFIFCNFDNEETPRAVGLSQYKGMITGAYDVLYRNNPLLSDKYLIYYFLYIDDSKRFKPLYKGLRKTVPFDSFMSYKIPVPSRGEQDAVVEYLDAVTSKIDEAIAQQQKMIDLLNERKQIIINNAVTKGLDPNVKMKPSGIDWIGDIPEHWEIRRIRFIGEATNGLTYSPIDIVNEGEGILVLRSSNIKDGKLIFEDNVYVKHAPTKLMVKKNDIIICSRNGSASLVGKCAIVESDMCASFGAFMMRFRSEYNSKYIYYLLTSAISHYKQLFATSTINQLTLSIFADVKVAIILDDKIQNEIADKLDHICSKIDKAIEGANRQISLLQERKQIIINDVVTGKVKVV